MEQQDQLQGHLLLIPSSSVPYCPALFRSDHFTHASFVFYLHLLLVLLLPGGSWPSEGKAVTPRVKSLLGWPLSAGSEGGTNVSQETVTSILQSLPRGKRA